MKSYKIELSRQAAHILERMAVREAGVYRRISTAFADLEKDPYQGKALKGQLKGRYSYRVGSYRIIYAIHERILTVFIIDVGHRGDIYR